MVSSGARSAAAGYRHTMMLKQDGSVWVTGSNTYGQLGDGSYTDRRNFVRVVSSGAIVVAAGKHHSMVLQQDGGLWATGRNTFGQLGDGSEIDRNCFTVVANTIDGLWCAVLFVHLAIGRS